MLVFFTCREHTLKIRSDKEYMYSVKYYSNRINVLLKFFFFYSLTVY